MHVIVCSALFQQSANRLKPSHTEWLWRTCRMPAWACTPKQALCHSNGDGSEPENASRSDDDVSWELSRLSAEWPPIHCAFKKKNFHGVVFVRLSASEDRLKCLEAMQALFLFVLRISFKKPCQWAGKCLQPSKSRCKPEPCNYYGWNTGSFTLSKLVSGWIWATFKEWKQQFLPQQHYKPIKVKAQDF